MTTKLSGNLVTTAGLLLILLFANAAYPSDQIGNNSRAEAVVREIMAADISRCHSSVNGVKMISFVPPTDAEVAQIRSLGIEAIPPLAAYLDLKSNDGFTQLFAVGFWWTSAARRLSYPSNERLIRTTGRSRDLWPSKACLTHHRSRQSHTSSAASRINRA